MDPVDATNRRVHEAYLAGFEKGRSEVLQRVLRLAGTLLPKGPLTHRFLRQMEDMKRQSNDNRRPD